MQSSEAFFSEFMRKGIVYHEQDGLNTLMTNLMARGVISAEYAQNFIF